MKRDIIVHATKYYKTIQVIIKVSNLIDLTLSHNQKRINRNGLEWTGIRPEWTGMDRNIRYPTGISGGV
jgi:hypothetical protein